MPITVFCKRCANMIYAPDDGAGKMGKCPACQADVAIPYQSEQQAPVIFTPQTPPPPAAYAPVASQRNAFSDAMAALKIVLSDPTGGQSRGLALLGDAKALPAGLVFHAAVIAVSFFASRSGGTALGSARFSNDD